MLYELLIVDDEELSRNTISTCFPWEQVGFNVAGQAQNGLEALRFLEQHMVHVVLCDVSMPVLSGLDFAQRVATSKNPPILIFFSGYRDFEYARQAFVYGVRFYLVKPLKYEEIVQTFTTLKRELDLKLYNTPFESDSLNESTFIHKINNYVHKHYQTASLKEASEKLYLNSSYISQLYKQKTGKNFSDYVMEIRMESAKKLLKDPSMKIYAIGAHVGYTNAKNFTRSFRLYYGITPKEYRENYLMRVSNVDD